MKAIKIIKALLDILIYIPGFILFAVFGILYTFGLWVFNKKKLVPFLSGAMAFGMMPDMYKTKKRKLFLAIKCLSVLFYLTLIILYYYV